MKFFEKVYYIVNQIPEGRVATYGQIAAMSGSPRAARQVGWAMSRCPEGTPAHRVINSQGILSGAGAFEMPGHQAMLLTIEGVEVKNDRVDLDTYLWYPDPEILMNISDRIGREQR